MPSEQGVGGSSPPAPATFQADRRSAWHEVPVGGSEDLPRGSEDERPKDAHLGEEDATAASGLGRNDCMGGAPKGRVRILPRPSLCSTSSTFRRLFDKGLIGWAPIYCQCSDIIRNRAGIECPPHSPASDQSGAYRACEFSCRIALEIHAGASPNLVMAPGLGPGTIQVRILSLPFSSAPGPYALRAAIARRSCPRLLSGRGRFDSVGRRSGGPVAQPGRAAAS